ncbi:hypothetical protein INT43_004618 [Umbelopsis isabellina]|uniref:Carnitine dehydratase n=1 Tax=Mortierella isabellina TaxID=91625 RepID=A0A8H7UB72_MORIS|nr:hypothetical protein INT43_004618 [Umbelopsis isabellina]
MQQRIVPLLNDLENTKNKILGEEELIAELKELLQEAGESADDLADYIEKIEIHGQDPVVDSTIKLGSASTIALLGKAVTASKIYYLRTGKKQSLSVDLRGTLRRLAPGVERRWEALENNPPGLIDPSIPEFFKFYKTKDGRYILPLNIYPKIKSKFLNLLNCGDRSELIQKALEDWTAADLEKKSEELEFVCPMIRTLDEFKKENVYEYLSALSVIEIEKIGESKPEPFVCGENVKNALEGIKAVGLGHVIAGAGTGRALALHGAECLNIWNPNEVEHDGVYYSANVGVRSTMLNLATESGLKKMKELVKQSDILYSNRKFNMLSKFGLTAEDCAKIRPGIVHCNITAHGQDGPWKNRMGFDQVAGSVCGMMTFEGDGQKPQMPCIGIVNDYIVSWLAAMGCMIALMRRAEDGGSYKVHVSLTRAALWVLSLGIFDKDFINQKVNSCEKHTHREPEMFEAETVCGHYRGVTDQVHMSELPERYNPVLVPRGLCKPEFLKK